MIPEPAPAVKRAIRAKLLRWFAAHGRDLPWRSTGPDGRRDPYRVWLAEVMLQQTQVAAVIPYYARWLARFPTLAALAAAPVDDVLKQWEGLGYYTRARNFHRAAQAVIRERGGQVPDTVEGLLSLPGVGRYTAGAVASLAFGRDAAILDGNTRRVLSRLFAVDGPPATAQRRLWALSEALLPPGRAGAFNEALMDLGATLCAPRAPDCPRCPLRATCMANAAGDPQAYPPKRARAALPHKHFATAVLCAEDGSLLLAQRPMHGLLGGLWEFPGGEIGAAETAPAPQLSAIIRAQTGLRVTVRPEDFAGQVRRAFTHFRVTRRVAVVTLRGKPRVKTGGGHIALRWASRDELGRMALTRGDRDILAAIVDARRPET